MRNFQDTFETRTGPFIGAFSVCMTVPLKVSKVWLYLKMKFGNRLIKLTKRKRILKC